jgi:cytochrome c biogenesis protein
MNQQNTDFTFSFEGITVKEYTGLQVTKDPGVWVVWTGCALLIVGFILSFFFSHQRVWIRVPKSTGKEIVLAGSTSKNRIGFESVFQGLAEGIRSLK